VKLEREQLLRFLCLYRPYSASQFQFNLVCNDFFDSNTVYGLTCFGSSNSNCILYDCCIRYGFELDNISSRL
jgi:hypothetical protein